MSEVRTYIATEGRSFEQSESSVHMRYTFAKSGKGVSDDVRDHLLFELLLEVQLMRVALERLAERGDAL